MCARNVAGTWGGSRLSLARAVLLSVLVVAACFCVSSSLAYGDSAPSYCVISSVHVSSVTPTDYSSTLVGVTAAFSISCSGSPGTVWDVQTRVYAESSLLGVSQIGTGSPGEQYSFGQGTVQYVVRSQFDAMSYFAYGEQTPSFYVQITVINTSTGSLDAQQQAPFGVDTSQYPFNLEQHNYCNFPGLSQYFKLLPGCGGSSETPTVSTAPASNSCNTYGLPQYFQQYLPGCDGNGNEPPTPSQTSGQETPTQQPGNALTQPNTPPTTTTTATGSSDWSTETILGIVATALATCLVAVLIVKRTRRVPARPNGRGRFCAACGIQLRPYASFCDRCGRGTDDETYTFQS